ncbi:MAG TPA: ureidoglycolate lyase [Rhodothermales bacterium]|nr:ureidoglycolate lyase [Rhodothermales bacterium]
MNVQPEPISPERFAAYGRVAKPPAGKPLVEGPEFRYWSDAAHYHVEGDTEVGYCTVYRQPDGMVSWMERHDRTPEILIPVDRPFLLPVMGKDDRVEVFQVEPGQAAIIGESVWHSACIPAEGGQATYFVIFRRGTPQEDVTKKDIAPVSIAA